jgi:hypothetical protein
MIFHPGGWGHSYNFVGSYERDGERYSLLYKTISHCQVLLFRKVEFAWMNVTRNRIVGQVKISWYPLRYVHRHASENSIKHYDIGYGLRRQRLFFTRSRKRISMYLHFEARTHGPSQIGEPRRSKQWNGMKWNESGIHTCTSYEFDQGGTWPSVSVRAVRCAVGVIS